MLKALDEAGILYDAHEMGLTHFPKGTKIKPVFKNGIPARHARLIIFPDGTVKKICTTHSNPWWYRTPLNKALPIDMTEFDGITSHGVPMRYRGQNIMQVGHWSISPNRYLGLRPEGTTGEEQLEFSVKRITFDGEDQPIDVSKNTAVNALVTDKGSVLIHSTRNGVRQLVKVTKPIKHSFEIEYLIEPTGQRLVRKKVDGAWEYWFHSEKTGEFRSRIIAPQLLDKDFKSLDAFRLLIADAENPTRADMSFLGPLVEHRLVKHRDGTMTYIKRSTALFERLLDRLPDTYYIDADTYYSSTSDGRLIANNIGSSWSDMHDASEATWIYATQEQSNLGMIWNGTRRLQRAYFYFDLSAASSPFSDADFYGYQWQAASPAAMTLAAVEGTQADPFVKTNWGAYGTTSFATATSNSTPEYKVWDFNAAGITYCQGKAGSTAKIVLIENSYDLPDTDPGSSSIEVNFDFRHTEYTGTTQDPYLEITESSAESIDTVTAVGNQYANAPSVTLAGTTTDCDAQNLTLELRRGTPGRGAGTLIHTITGIQPSSGAFSTTVDLRTNTSTAEEFWHGTNYFLDVYLASDSSVNNQSIAFSILKVTIMGVPDGAEVWYQNENNNIMGVTYGMENGVDTIDLDLWDGYPGSPVFDKEITNAVALTHDSNNKCTFSYAWAISTTTPQSDYKARVYATGDTTKDDYSDATFTISKGTITITAPGEAVEIDANVTNYSIQGTNNPGLDGQNFTVQARFARTGSDTLMDELSVAVVPAGGTWSIVWNLVTDSSTAYEAWHRATGDTYIKAFLTSDSAIMDYSDDFGIKPIIALTGAFDAGETYDQNTAWLVTAHIYGLEPGLHTVEADLSDDSGSTFTALAIANAVAVTSGSGNQGTISTVWEIGSQTPASIYRVRVGMTGAESSYNDSSSQDFTIGTRTATITSPNDGTEEWGVGKPHNITGTITSSSGNFDTVALYYSTDGGGTYPNLIDASVSIVANAFTKSWTIPNAAQDDIRVKAIDASAEAGSSPTSDVSNNDFTIYKLDQTALDPGGGETLYIGESDYTWLWDNVPAAASGATNVKLWYCTDFSGSKTWVSLIATTTNDGTAVIAVPNAPSADCGFKVEELDGELLTVEIAATFTIMVRTTVGRKRAVKSYLVIEGNDIPVRDFKVHTSTEGNVIVRDIEVILPRRSFLSSTALLGLHAKFYHGVFDKNARMAFDGPVVEADIDTDEVVLTLIDCTHYLGGERIAIDENVSGWTLGGLSHELLHRTDKFGLTTFQSDLTPDISRMPSDLKTSLPGLTGFDAVNEMMEAAVLIKSMTDVTEYFLMNPYADVGRIKGVPELDAINLHLPSHEAVDLDPGVDAGIPLTRVVMQSKTDSSVEASFTNTAVEQLHGPSPVVVKKFPSESPDRLKEAAVHYALLNRKPKAAFSLNYHGGYFLRPLMGLNVGALDLPVDSAYILETEYEGDLYTKVSLDTRRPSLFDLLQ